jgi:Ribonuclease G/E
MKGSVVAFDTLEGGARAAARVVDGKLDDLLIDPKDDPMRPGALYRARAGRPMKGQGGRILDTPDGPLFLRQSKGISDGEMVLAQVSTFAGENKAVPATLKPVFKSRFCLVTQTGGQNISKAIKDEDRRVELLELLADLPDNALGLVIRTSAADADDAAIADDIAQTLALAQGVLSEPMSGPAELLLDGPDAADRAWRDWPAPDITDAEAGSFARHGIDAMIAKLRSPHEALGAGALMFVEPTRALVSVDVNTGDDTSPAAALKANIAAMKALPRALRVRGLGGQIVVDLAPLAKRDRRQIESITKAAFRTDPIETTLVGWTPLGHLECVRKRERTPLSEVLR